MSLKAYYKLMKVRNLNFLWQITLPRLPRPEVIKHDYSLKLKIKHSYLAACGHVSASSQSFRFILSLRMNSNCITSGPGVIDDITLYS